jgi:hypothetical protein
MPTDHGLTGEALRSYETWRVLGLSESAAMEALGEDGVLPRDGFEDDVRSYMTAFDLPRAAAVRAAVGRHDSAREARRAAVAPEGRWAASRQNDATGWRH